MGKKTQFRSLVLAVVVIGLCVEAGGSASAATVVHTPPPTAAYRQPITIEARVECAAQCSGTLYHRPGGELLAPLSAFESVPMERVTLSQPGGEAVVLRGVIPGAAVDTRGVEYAFGVTDGETVTWWPTSPPSSSTVVSQHVRVIEPPHVIHAPVATAYFGHDVSVTVASTCVTDRCTGTLRYRTSGHDWSTQAMVAMPGDNYMWTFSGTVPGAAATTEGVDYSVTVGDGHVEDTSPLHHITVVAPTGILHSPTLTAFPAQPIRVEAFVACSTSSCSVDLSYRATGSGLGADPPWTTVAMTMADAPITAGDASTLQRWVGEVPAQAVTVLGVDYRIHASDGFTNAHSPGSAYAATSAVRVDGQGLYWFHVHVAEPVRLAHTPVAVTPMDQAVTVQALMTCSTNSCSATLGYRTSPSPSSVDEVIEYLNEETGFTEIPMTATTVTALGGLKIVDLAATIPAAAVTAPGVDYWIHASDGATSAWYPGTTYSSGIGSIDGSRVAWQHIVTIAEPSV